MWALYKHIKIHCYIVHLYKIHCTSRSLALSRDYCTYTFVFILRAITELFLSGIYWQNLLSCYNLVCVWLSSSVSSVNLDLFSWKKFFVIILPIVSAVYVVCMISLLMFFFSAHNILNDSKLLVASMYWSRGWHAFPTARSPM